MSSFIRRFSIVLALMLATGLSAAAKKTNAPSAYQKNDATQKETTIAPYQQGHGLMDGQMRTEYNAPGRIDLDQGWNVWVKGSFIYWQALEGNLDAARSWIIANTLYPKHQQYYKMDFDYKPGFKISMGTSFGEGYDAWDVRARYTWLHLQDKVTYNINEYVFVPFFWLHYNYGSVSHIAAKWDLDIDLLDLELGRSFYAGTKLIMRPFVGLKGGWLDQRFDDNLTAYYSAVGTYNPYYHGKVDTWKIGGRIGLDFSWFFKQNFCLLANLNGSLLYSHYHASYTNYGYSLFDSFYTLTSKKEGSLVQPVFETSLGLNWGSYFHNNRLHYNFSALYEFQVFLREKQFIVEQSASGGNDRHNQSGLYLHGLTVNTRMDF